MLENLILISIIITVCLFIILIKNKNNKKVKYLILFSPLVLGVILYISIFLFTKDIPAGACDGIALVGIFFSLLLIGISILLIIVHLIINNIPMRIKK